MGLTPQSVHVFGGYKVQGKTADAAAQLIADAKTLEQAGAALLLLECVPSTVAAQETPTLDAMIKLTHAKIKPAN